MNAPTPPPTELAGHLNRLGLLVDMPAPADRPASAARASGEAEALWRAGAVPAPDLAEALAGLHRVQRMSFAEVAAARPRIEGLSRNFLREAFAYPFELDGAVAIAVADPTGEHLPAVRLALGGAPRLVIVSFEEIDLLFERATPDAAGHAAQGADAAAAADTVEALKDLARGAPVVRLVDQLMERAIDLGATDIHIETGRDELRVRLRVDGHLRTEQTAPRHLAAAVISRVKILANLDIAERRLPQDGRANVFIGRNEADLRVATMPTMYGETAVLRILLKDSRLLEFERIGLGGRDLAAFKSLLAEPHGIVIVTGPTGSGKTTTLATAMQVLNDPTRKIVTVEDPIEYQIPGVHQTQIKPSIGLTFATALRSFLRHDPDVIMVGEMRDAETAAVGAQAALTGHLVLTTLHTNSATDSVVRLADMGVESYLIASALRGVLGQRLVRRLCERCKREDAREAETARALAEERGFRIDPMARFFAAQGCAACGQTGYRGRVGVFEVMRVDDHVRSMIRENPDPTAMLAAARKGGLTTMLEDGVAKAGRGMTTISEVLRTTG
ncbi:GspE/PulE family protein [Chenggangzhangella methanolivorans]|uniref:GspE/PulE family protein n=1 Tax=Chenggangzhangella methanolivorans TaxID=1437009 RepID=A0A9E6RDE5_9HYPH|nr:GspE/PulE family protein [Chenggangzhangella methanolivorans]QZO01815.1 GspE/PulE family protein [Chenggangzhangella methanolivorans]